MSEQKITLAQGGAHGFVVEKTIADGTERFSVSQGMDRYGESRRVIASGTWAETSNALTAFSNETDAAVEALVQIATLTALGGQEEIDE